MSDIGLKALERAVQLAPDDFSLSLRLAEEYARQRYAEAPEIYRRIMREFPHKYWVTKRDAAERGMEVWIGQPLPDFAEYRIGPANGSYLDAFAELRDVNLIFQPYLIAQTIPRITVPRPLTPEETIQAIMEDSRLFNHRFLTSTTVAYCRDSTKFTIVEIYDSSSFPYEPFDPDQRKSVELDARQDRYNTPLTLNQVLEHEGWNTIIPNSALLKNMQQEFLKYRTTSKQICNSAFS